MPPIRDTRTGLFLSLLGLLLLGVLPVSQAGDQLRLTICDTEGECCAGGEAFPIDDAWIDPDTGNLQAVGSVNCAPGWPQITDFSVTPDTVSGGQQFSIDWQAVNATSCIASGDLPAWAGLKDTAGSESHTAEGSTQEYTLVLACWNAEGQNMAEIGLSVTE